MTKKFNIVINGQSQRIAFEVMGLDNITADFLNWCMEHRDNLEFIKECKTLDKASQSSVLHADHLKIIRRIDDTISHNRT